MTAEMGGFLPALTGAAVVAPLVLALGLLFRAGRPVVAVLSPLAALPALLAAALWSPGETRALEIPWLLVGTRLGLDETTRVFLVFTAILWGGAALYARGYLTGHEGAGKARFYGFLLFTMAGNLGLILARDLASFYLFFVLMSFASYGLIVHDQTRRARRAGNVYLSMVLVGEAFILPATLLAAATATTDIGSLPEAVAASPARDAIIGLALAGFGVKAGALPLHLWLPLAHSAAPTPASVVLSGAMIKAGLLGWITFLPGGELSMGGWGLLLICGGMIAAFAAIVAGLVQEERKTLLAYSSISQMGFMTAGLGCGLVVPEAWPVSLLAVTLYAAHHALLKGALFLGVGVYNRSGGRSVLPVLAGMGVLGLAVAGAPFTSGAAAKEYLKEAVYPLPGFVPGLVETLLQAAAVGTTLIMVRLLYGMWLSGGAGGAAKTSGGRPPLAMLLPWAALVAAVILYPLTIPAPPGGPAGALLTTSALWPPVMGVLLALAAVFLYRRAGAARGLWRRWSKIPEGDLLVAVEAGGGRVGALARLAAASAGSRIQSLAGTLAKSNRKAGDLIQRQGALLESRLGDWTTGGIALACLILFLALATALS